MSGSEDIFGGQRVGKGGLPDSVVDANPVVITAKDSQVIDGGLGAYTAKDVVGEDDCCTTLAVPWEFEVALTPGGRVRIHEVRLFNETENQGAQYDLLLFNAVPTGELRDNAANTNPVKGDISKYLNTISLPFSIANGATVATTAKATPSTSGGLPMIVQCAVGTKKLYGVLVTNTAYTQTAGDAIQIEMDCEQLKE